MIPTLAQWMDEIRDKHFALKPIPGYEGLYSITEDGKLYSHRARRMIGGFLNKDGYPCVVLTRMYGRWYVGIHHLVALAWLECPGEGFEVNHKNGVRTDNRVDNLEWVTHKQNCTPDRALFLSSKHAPEKIEVARLLRTNGLSGVKIAALTGISQAHVYRILSGQRRTYAHFNQVGEG